uniref:tyrosine-type recombinase/integrase n=1 Tax=Shewanella colwelliana TaxID=23 RepID=UPI003736EC66
MKTIKLTLKLIHSLPPQSRAYTIQDSVCRGLGVRISPDKRLNYVIHRVVDNRTRTRILAPVSALSVKAARDRAVIQLQAWQAELHQCVITSSPRFDVFVEQTWKPMVFDRWKQGTKETALIALNKRLLPTFGRYPLHTITHKAVQAWFDDVSKTRKGAANRNLDVLLSVFKLALRQGYCERNPASGIKQNKRRVLNRFLSVDEIRRLSRALDEAEKQGQSISQCCDILRLLLLTGCRLSEITYLKGGDVRGNELHLPDSKTGAKVVHIGQAAVKILNNYRCQPNGPLFPMAHKTATSSVQALWLRLRAKAGIEDVRLHDLRHTFAS